MKTRADFQKMTAAEIRSYLDALERAHNGGRLFEPVIPPRTIGGSEAQAIAMREHAARLRQEREAR